MELRFSFLNQIKDLTQTQLDHKGISNKPSTSLYIDPSILKILNSLIGKDGIARLGNGYKELNFIFKYLFKEERNKVCFIDFKGSEDIDHIIFNEKQTDKDWMKKIYNAILTYNPPADIIDDDLQIVSDKIIEYKNALDKRFPDGFSEGNDLKQYNQGEIIYEDETLARELLKYLIDIVGRFTYSKMITGTIYFDGTGIKFVTPSWKSFRTSFKHHNRLLLKHFYSTKGNAPPGAATHPGSFSFVLDSYIFGPTLRLSVVREQGALPKESLINCPHVPTDYWNPAYLSYNKIPVARLIEYTDHLSNWLLSAYGLKMRTSVIIEISKSRGTRMFLDVLLKKYEQKVLSQVDSQKDQDIYLFLIEEALYDLLFLGKSYSKDVKRKQIKTFLKGGDIDNIVIDLEISDLPSDLRSIELTSADRFLWAEEDLDKTFYDSIAIKTRGIKRLQTNTLLKNLEEPITNLGISLREIALSYGNPKEGVPKKIYLIPTVNYIHGLGQRSGQNQYVDAATDTVQIEEKNWKCWELDGSNNGDNLGTFKEKYEKVLRSLLEGRCTIFIFAVDGDGQHQSIAAINIIQGALSVNDIHFTSKNEYRTFTSILMFDLDIYNKLSTIMRFFKSCAVPLLPVVTKDPYDDYQRHSFIFDFFK